MNFHLYFSNKKALFRADFWRRFFGKGQIGVQYFFITVGPRTKNRKFLLFIYLLKKKYVGVLRNINFWLGKWFEKKVSFFT